MSGTLELSTSDREITLERSSLTGPMSDFRAWDSRTGSNLEDLTGKTCGQTLLGVEAAVYARSAYLRQQRISVSADAQLEKRLSGLVTAGSEDYAYGEIDEKLKKLQTALRHNQSGALPRAEARSLELQRRLDEMEDSRQRLSALEESLRELRAQREECRAVLAALDSLDRQERQERVNAADAFCREYIAAHGGHVDYIHGDETARELGSRPGCGAVILPPVEKDGLFTSVLTGGALPRKSFSMGHAEDKRYYLECRRIRP